MKYFLFDLDGTLIDSSEGIFRSFEYAFIKLGMSPPAEQALRLCIGPPLLQSFLNFFNGDREKAELGVKLYRERYRIQGWKECKLYPHVQTCLKTLCDAGKILALATAKPQAFAEKILAMLEVDGYFSAVVGSKEDNSFDDKSKIIAKAMKLLSADPQRTVMVGDRFHDIIGAKENGIASVGLKTGFAIKGELENAGVSVLAENFSELTALLLKWNRIFYQKY